MKQTCTKMFTHNIFENLKRLLDFYMVLVVLFFDFTNSLQNSGSCRNDLSYRRKSGMKVNSLYTFESLFLFGASECAESCYRRKICKSVNFFASNYTCQFNSIAISSLTTVYDEDVYYIGKENMYSVSIKS